MTIYYLYVKTHIKTGLKYLGQTKQNPFKYKGSGTDWKNHIKQFGNQVNTEIIFQTSSIEERNKWGRYYSILWNIVTSSDDFGNKIWANKVIESGGGGNYNSSFSYINSLPNQGHRLGQQKEISSSGNLAFKNKLKTDIEFKKQFSNNRSRDMKKALSSGRAINPATYHKWISNDDLKETRYVSKYNIDNYLINGWYYGKKYSKYKKRN